MLKTRCFAGFAHLTVFVVVVVFAYFTVFVVVVLSIHFFQAFRINQRICLLQPAMAHIANSLANVLIGRQCLFRCSF